MTVGISFTNDKEAIAITDSRVSSGIRQSDAVDKMTTFTRPGYHGVLFGTGLATLLEGVRKHIPGCLEDTFDKFVVSLQTPYQAIVNTFERTRLAGEKEKVLAKASLIDNPEHKERFINDQLGELMRKFDKDREESYTCFITTAYDRSQGRTRHWYFSDVDRAQMEVPHIEIGSGRDAANLYFTTKLQGIEPRTLTRDQLAFFAMNAYSMSTVNQGVGGVPKIALIDKDECRIIDARNAIAMANLSGAYLAETLRDGVDRPTVERYMGRLLSPNYTPDDLLANILNVNEETLTTTYIPYSSWQVKKNRKHYGEQKELV
ncbi:MAG TPA: hypothetical protein VJK03_02425 [Candidatus Nanoarchaeia archaeon]|nr:hypothetical protein [Candidatus Nanoarchaeia archaeon]